MSVHRNPEVEEEEHGMFEVRSICLEHALSQTVFCGLVAVGHGGGARVCCYRLFIRDPSSPGSFLPWSLASPNLLLHLCLPLYNSKTPFGAPMVLQFHTLNLSLFMLFPPNLLFLPMANYCLSSKTKLRCLLLQTGFQNLPDFHTRSCSTLFGVILCKRTGSSVKAGAMSHYAPQHLAHSERLISERMCE